MSDEAKREIMKQIKATKSDLNNSLSEINRNVDQVRVAMTNVLDEIRKDNRNVKAEVDVIKEYVQKIFKFVIDVRYNIKLF